MECSPKEIKVIPMSKYSSEATEIQYAEIHMVNTSLVAFSESLTHLRCWWLRFHVGQVVWAHASGVNCNGTLGFAGLVQSSGTSTYIHISYRYIVYTYLWDIIQLLVVLVLLVLLVLVALPVLVLVACE